MLDFPVSPEQLRSLRNGAVLVPDAAAVFRVQGPGALECLQGLLTSDLAAPGEASLVYGALLTAKGMIVADPWVLRESDGFTLVVAAEGGERTAELFDRVLPPRLARVSSLTGEWSAAWLLGPDALERFARVAASQIPGAGRVLRLGPGCRFAGAAAPAPMHGLVVGPASELRDLAERFARAGGQLGDQAHLAAARVLAGWPTLGREIDEKTLPQEVRFDELGAISYVKGCYTGQETVARIHFRGHVNRELRGVELGSPGALAERTLSACDKEVGGIKSALLLDDRVLGLALLRREVEPGARLKAGAREVRVVPLPFAMPVAA
jgi:folate-binding protein YgfZ